MAADPAAPADPGGHRSELPSKHTVGAALRRLLVSSLESMTAAARDSAAGATHEESRSEGDKDTRATEQSYIARGQAMRAEALGAELAGLDSASFDELAADAAVRPVALVALTSAGLARRVYLLAAFCAGSKLDMDGTTITVVTPSAPVGLALLGKFAGEEVELAGARGAVQWTIERVR